MLKFTQFYYFKELQEKPRFSKIPAESYEAEDFLNIFLRVWGF